MVGIAFLLEMVLGSVHIPADQVYGVPLCLVCGRIPDGLVAAVQYMHGHGCKVNQHSRAVIHRAVCDEFQFDLVPMRVLVL